VNVAIKIYRPIQPKRASVLLNALFAAIVQIIFYKVSAPIAVVNLYADLSGLRTSWLTILHQQKLFLIQSSVKKLRDKTG
jgi:hypothetical protein